MNKIEKLLMGPKAILKSRKLIKNLSSSLYQYLILRKQNIELKLRNGETIIVSRFLYPRIIYYYYLGYIIDINKYEIKVRSLDNKTYSISMNALYSNHIGGIVLLIKSNWQYKNDYWEKNGIKFKHAYGSICEVFDEESYKFLNVKNKNI
ncbi:MAG: FkbM family methyltransferase, partial [Candidatus Nanopusillus sp.]|nr:FkbM family methyltransferase [Candidatus Nanopusillus sp.]